MYNKKVMDYFTNPRNAGKMDSPDGVGRACNSVDGDEMILYLKIRDNRITEATFQTYGCAAAIASSSMTTELLKNRTLEEALSLKNEEVVEALGGLPPKKADCSVLTEDAVRSAIEDYRKKT
ncbi:MAG: iron-sulfur cluster assembly scaffold protein [candidate division WOR-3 bacterium]|nr:iron-sulfur cluster assembly scaffold protein [candidate division WOR-3 bacterium]